MANEGDWVEDVKRWYLAGARAATAAASSDAAHGDYGVDLGYEAAHPSLQARHWPGTADFTTDR